MRYCLILTVVAFLLTGCLRGFILNSISPSTARLGHQVRLPNTLLLSEKKKKRRPFDKEGNKAPTDSTPFELENESVRLALKNVASASAFVSNVENEYDEWKNRVKEYHDLVKANLKNGEMLRLYKEERKETNERLKEARESLDKAHERLAVAKASANVEKWYNRVQLNSSDTFALERLKKADERLDKANERLNTLLKLRAPDQIILKEMHERFDAMAEEMAYSATLRSAWNIGTIELERLKRDRAVLEAKILKDETPFLSRKEQDEAKNVKNERELISYLTPFFDAALNSSNMVFVNSENINWLPQSRNPRSNIKPDGFSTHPGMFVKKDDPGVTGRLYGKAVKELFDCVVLFEGKVKINDAAFGQVTTYLNYLNPKGSGIAILFDCTSFWMITSSKGKIVKVVKSKWVNKGSTKLFQNFIMENKPSWICCLQDACEFFKVVVKEGDAFLGRGAFGRVFKVFRDEEEFALKIVEESSICRLHKEVTALEKAKHTNLTIKLKEGIKEFSTGAAILLSPVGRKLPKLKRKKDVVELFVLLHQLHDQGLVHGDPRKPNVILYDNQLMWIDLVDVLDVSVQQSSHLLYKDIATLTRSILSKPHNANLGDLESVLKKYSEDASKKNLDAVVNKVCQILKYD